MDSLREKLLKLLDGTHSQSWVSRTDLLAKSGAVEGEFSAVYEQLRNARVINTCNIIRPGGSIESVWLTGYVEKAARQGFTIPLKLPPSGSLRREQPPAQQPNKPAKEEIMEEQKTEKSIPQQVLDIIIGEPGIVPSALRARFPTDKKTQKAISNALNNLRVAKRIERRDDSGTERLHPTDNAAPPINSRGEKHQLPYKLMSSDQAKNLAQTGAVAPSIAGCAETQQLSVQEQQPAPTTQGRLTFGFFDDGKLVIEAPGREKLILTNDETVRLRNFIGRIKPEAKCA